MFDEVTLANGLRIVGEPMSHIRSCTLGLWVKVGSMDERPGENGLSHLMEHMVFKGTATRTARAIAEEMDEVGGQLNAFTSKECTCYYAKVMDSDLPLAVDILTDLALHPAFDAAELAKEQGVVLEEIAMVEDTPEDLVHDLLSEAQYSGTLREPILGTAATIRSYTRDALVRYWQRHYVPGNMVVAVAGQYQWAQVVDLVTQHFEGASAAAPPAPSQGSQGILSGRKAREKNTEQLHICLGYPGIPMGEDDQYPLSVLSNLWGGGMSSRLFQRIREDLGMAYSIYTYPSSHPGCGTFTLYAGTAPENGETVLKEIEKERRLLLEKGITPKEFASAKAQLRSGYVMGLESSSGRMQSIGRSALLMGRLYTPEQRLDKIDRTTQEDVARLATQLLGARPSAAIVGKDAQRFLSLVD